MTKARFHSASLIVAAIVIWSDSVPASPAAQIQMKYFPQSQSEWCWAASAQMLLAQQGVAVTQCAQANKQFQRGDCCGTAPSGEHGVLPNPCNQPGVPVFGTLQARTNSRPFKEAEIQEQIDTVRKPFIFTRSWQKDTVGHMMIANGWANDNGRMIIHVLDPQRQDQAHDSWQDNWVYYEDDYVGDPAAYHNTGNIYDLH